MEKKWASQSLFSTMAKCPKKYEYVEIQGLVRRQQPRYLHRGTLTHAGVEEGLKHQTTNETRIRGVVSHAAHQHRVSMGLTSIEDVERTDEIVELAAGLAQRAVKKILAEFEPMVIDGLPAVEYPVAIYTPGSRVWEGVRGKIDLVAKKRTTQLPWVIDVKTAVTPRPEFSHFYDHQTQLPLYAYMLWRQHGIAVAGTATLEIRAALEDRPKLNKNGTMSRAKVICTWNSYMNALIEAGLDPEEYLDMKGKLPESMDRFFYQRRTPDELEAVWNNSLEYMHFIENVRDCYPRSLSPWNCDRCSLKELCRAELLGEDAEYIRQTEYTTEKEDRYPEMELS